MQQKCMSPTFEDNFVGNAEFSETASVASQEGVLLEMVVISGMGKLQAQIATL